MCLQNSCNKQRKAFTVFIKRSSGTGENQMGYFIWMKRIINKKPGNNTPGFLLMAFYKPISVLFYPK